jgi:hypothetical protein
MIADVDAINDIGFADGFAAVAGFGLAVCLLALTVRAVQLRRRRKTPRR